MRDNETLAFTVTSINPLKKMIIFLPEGIYCIPKYVIVKN
jgi:hypothetical protein